MSKPLYKKVRVIHNPHTQKFIVEFKNTWFRWVEDRDYCYYEKDENPRSGRVFSKDDAQSLSIKRAEELLDTNIIYEKSNIVYYV